MKIQGKQTIVVKLGTNALVGPNGQIEMAIMTTIADQISRLRHGGCDVVIVSSGAVACGKRARPDAPNATLIEKCALAAVGQPLLMAAWQSACTPIGIITAEVLADYQRVEHDTMIAIVRQMLDNGDLPIFNYNDAASVVEMEYLATGGDNDWLAVKLARRLSASQIVLLTSVDGLLRRTSSGGFERIARVNVGRDSVAELGNLLPTDRPTGMASKIKAAQDAVVHGVTAYIANAREPNVLCRLIAGDDVGTHFY